MPNLPTDLFFDTAAYAHRDLLAADTAWTALKSLQSYMDAQTYQRTLFGPGADGRPLTHHLVLFNGSIMAADDTVSIDFGDATKGRLVVQRHGEPLPGASVIMAGAVLVGADIRLGQGVLVESGAFLKAPLIVGDRTEIRQGAYLRGYCLIGERCVVGHTTEIKHSIFLDDAKAGHFAYIGDSILGNRVNLGAGTKLANFRFLPGNVRIKTTDGPVDSGLRKLGALLGDETQTGCNSVTSPGTLIGPRSLVMPNVTVPSGAHPAKSILR